MFIDRLDKLEKIPKIFLEGGLALVGYRATGNWTGAVTALVGLRLAEGQNLAGGAAGVATLALIGLNNAFKHSAGPGPYSQQASYSGKPEVPVWMYPSGGWV